MEEEPLSTSGRGTEEGPASGQWGSKGLKSHGLGGIEYDRLALAPEGPTWRSYRRKLPPGQRSHGGTDSC